MDGVVPDSAAAVQMDGDVPDAVAAIGWMVLFLTLLLPFRWMVMS